MADEKGRGLGEKKEWGCSKNKRLPKNEKPPWIRGECAL